MGRPFARPHFLSPLRSDVSLPLGLTSVWGRWSAEWGLSASQLHSPRLPLGSACSPSPSQWKRGAHDCPTSTNSAAQGQAQPPSAGGQNTEVVRPLHHPAFATA